MNETQKKVLMFWTKLLLIATSCLAILVGMFMGNKIAIGIMTFLTIYILVYAFVIWCVQRVYLWRIMGVLTPEEYDVVKWYRFSLLENGPSYILDYLNRETNPNQWHIEIFTKVAEVKIPKILLDKSAKV